MLSSTLLKEKLNLHGKIGCILSIIGSTVIIIHAPEEDKIDDLYEIGRNMCSIGEYTIVWTVGLHWQLHLANKGLSYVID